MATKKRNEAKLERAYVQGKVIRSGLEHLAACLDDADTGLRRELDGCTERFDEYMEELEQARHGGRWRGERMPAYA